MSSEDVIYYFRYLERNIYGCVIQGVCNTFIIIHIKNNESVASANGHYFFFLEKEKNKK